MAVSLVVAYHGLSWGPLPENLSGPARWLSVAFRGGWLGVQLFFVLSGFLITGILLDGRETAGYYKRFYLRRARRILPAYLALLLALVCVRLVTLPFLVASLFFVPNLVSLLGIPLQYAPLWSLGVEEQFYLLWPLAVRRLSRRGLAVVSLSIVGLTPLVRFFAWRNGWTGGLYSYTWFVSDGLSVGALLAMYLRTARATRASVVRLATGMGACGAVILVAGIPVGILHRDTGAGAVAQLVPWHFLFGSLLLGVLLIGTSRWARLVTPAWLRYLGRVSYGLYLIHLLAFTEVDWLAQRIWGGAAVMFAQTSSGFLTRFILGAGLGTLIAAISRESLEEWFLARRGQQQAGERPAEQPPI